MPRSPHASSTRPVLFAWLKQATLWLLLALPLAATAAGVSGVGVAPIRIPDPVGGKLTDGYVFYPSAQPVKGTTTMGPYEVAAKIDAPALPGSWPLVVISHGNGGSRLGHHDLATYLASHGFIVATLNHPKDDFQDTSGVGHLEVLAGRPVQVRSTITTVLTDPRWKKLVDPTRIGVAGFSAGGYTSLMVVGAVPHFDRFVSYCADHMSDVDMCGPEPAFRAEAAKAGLTMEQLFGVMQEHLDKYGPTADPRVKAAFAMAPLSLIFDDHAFDKVTAPIYLYYAENDTVLRPDFNARHIQPLIHTLYAVKEVPKAEHWVFLTPCTPALAQDIRTMCSDPEGVDRAKVHATLNADALAFFRKTLHVPEH